MKISQLILMAGALAALSCARLGEEDKAAEGRGGEIRFGVTATAPEGVLPLTKTTYGSVSGSTKILQWAKEDRISIYAPNEYNFYGDAFDNQVPAVSYTIGGQTLSGTTSTATGVTAVTPSLALQWGTATGASSHKFYGMYPDPSAYAVGEGPAGTPYTHDAFCQQDTRSKHFTCFLPSEQGAVVTDTYNFSNDMRYAFMTAYAAVERNAAVTLNFVPRYSVFEVHIGNAYVGEDFQLAKVELVASAQRLNGPYSVNIETGACTVPAPAATGTDKVVSKTFAEPLTVPNSTVPNSTVLTITFFTCPVAIAGSDDDNLTLKLTMHDGDEWFLPLKDTNGNWLAFEAGKYYAINCGTAPDPFVYEITTDAAEFTTTGAGASDGGTATVHLTSTKDKAGVKSGAPWKAQYSTNGTSWTDLTASKASTAGITLSAYTGAGATTGEDITVTLVKGTEGTGSVSLSYEFLTAPEDNSDKSGAIDLSRYNFIDNTMESTYETANCYVIRAPGWYKFPLVYGNAVKGASASTVNTSSFTCGVASGKDTGNYRYMGTGSGEQKFVDGAGTGIDSEHYQISGATAVGISWQDAANEVITRSGDNAYCIDEGYVYFYVPADKIQPCNAVLKVTKGSTTIWSWHIWMVPSNEDPTIAADATLQFGVKAVTNYQEVVHNMLTVNLGQLPPTSGTQTTYAAGTYYLRFVSSLSGVSEDSGTLTLTRPLVGAGAVTNAQGKYAMPYFQWGRKDPMLTSQGGSSTSERSKVAWDGSVSSPHASYRGDDTYGSANAVGDLKTAAANPHLFYTNNSDKRCWHTGNAYANMWDTAQKGTADNTSPQKSVYDPCPRGYRVAGKNDFTGFTTTGNISYTSSELNVKGSFNSGWTFKCNSSENSEGIFFPASGYRFLSDGQLKEVGGHGFYCSSSSYDASSGSTLYFNSSGVCPIDNNTRPRALGFAVRPVQE